MHPAVRTVLAAGVAWAIGVGGAWAMTPPTDKEVFGAITAYKANIKKLTDDAKTANKPVGAADRVKAIDDALKDISVSECSLIHLQQLLQLAGLSASSKSAQAKARLIELAQDKSAAGAEAMLTLLPFRLGEKEPVKRAEYVTNATSHPGLKDLLASSKGFRDLTAIAPTDKAINPMIAPSMLSLTVLMPEECGPIAASMLGRLYENITEMTGDDLKEQRELMRVKFLSMVNNAKAKVMGDDEKAKSLRQGLAEAAQFLDSALAKGTLVGGPAPEIKFTWSSFDPPVSKLSDLKGKVVVIDFWATWCGPCVGSFPDIKELAARYKDYPVVIVGVTSLQGKHWPELGKDPIDCKDNPQKEYDLMKEYIRQKGLTWNIAFGETNVFNPEYGVRGIPHVVILDPKGAVRHRALHPNSKVTPFKDKAQKIDDLLREFKLPAPPAIEG